jgi:voltage-gated potassium channel
MNKSVLSSVLLVMVTAVVFGVPMLPAASQSIWFNILFTATLIAANLAMDTYRRAFMVVAASTMVIEWISVVFELHYLMMASRIAMLLYFTVITIGLIIIIASTRRVTGRIIVDAISGYLLLGLVFALVFMVLNALDPAAYGFSSVVKAGNEEWHNTADYIYYAFVTYSTLGYGDMLPLTSAAKTLATLAAVTGQIYLTVIIAMLVGKFLGQAQQTDA